MADPTRYSSGLRRLHWWMALLIVAVYIAMEQRGIFPRASAGRAAMMQSHYWLGLLVFALALWRLALRRRNGAPPITPPLPVWQSAPSKLLHWSLYAFFIVMPLLGLATAWTDGKQVLIPFTQIAIPPLLAENEELAHRLEDVHVSIGEAFYWVIGLHVVAAAYHHFFRRDDTLRRML